MPLVRTLLVSALLALALSLDRASLGQFTSIVFSPAEIDTAAGGAQASPRPWAEASRRGAHWDRLSVRLEATALTDVYPNLFQTSDGPNGLRLELIQPATLALVVTERHYLRVPFHFVVGTPHRIELDWQQGGLCRLAVDGQTVFESRDEAVSKAALEFDRFVIGTGFARQRNFAGQIRHCVVELSGRTPHDGPVRAILICLGAVVVGLVVWLGAARGPGSDSGKSEPCGILGVALLSAVAGWLAFAANLPFGKWNVLLVPALVFLLPLARVENSSARSKLAARCAAIVVGLLSLGLAAVAWHGIASSVRWVVGTMAAIALLAGYAMSRSWRRALLLGAGALAAATAAALTPNAATIAAFSREMPIFAGAVLAVIVTATARIFQASAPSPVSRASRPYWRKLASAVPYLVFAAWAFRHDTLFVSGSEMHWEYFVGPVRTVKAGGWLLWDTPSQDGFLNILLPALLPFGAWQSFYLFHAVVLFAGAVLCYHLLQIALPGRPLAAAAIAWICFFHADPALIGPAPYPSSSAMRFLWIYVLLLGAGRTLLEPAAKLTTFVRRYSWAWIVGVLWSGESAAYCTVILWAPVMVHCHWAAGTIGERARLLWRAVRVPAAALTAVGLIIALFYLLRCGHLPRPGMHFLYSFAYAGGFGALPIAPAGPIWIFVGLVAISVALAARSGPLGDDSNGEGHFAVVCGATAIAIGTYFVGRAAGENATALLPLIVVVGSLLLRSGGSAAGLPWARGFVVLLVSLGIASTALAFLHQRRLPRFGLVNIERHIRPADEELQLLLARAGVRPDSPVTYYGFAAAMPRTDAGTFASTWLPNPFQLLEEPIAPEEQERILGRFLAGRHETGFMVQARGQFEERFTRWVALLERTHRVAATWESERYRVLRFEPSGEH